MPLTEEFTFRMGTTGVILNTDATSFPFVDVLKVRGLDSADYRTTQRENEGAEGTYMDAEFERGRNIVVEGVAYATTSTLEAYLDDLKTDYAPSTTLKKWYFKAPGVSERFLLVKPLGVRYDWETARRLGMIDIQIQMFAEDPRIYDAALQSFSLQLGALVYSGFAFPLGFNFGFGGTTSTSDSVTVTNSGKRSTPVVLTITGPVVNPRILNDTTGDEMVFNITLLAGETLVIDSKYRTVRYGGTDNRRSALIAPSWFDLVPGDNTIRFRAESGGAAILTIDFYAARR